MVKYDPKNWWGLIFQFHKSDTFRRLFWIMFSIAAFSTIVAYITQEVVGEENYSGTTVFHSILGFVISLLLVFRTNTAYDRWWEGRKHWGALVNLSRSMSIKLDAFLHQDEKEYRERLQFLISEYPAVFKEHLRNNKVKGNFPIDVHQPNLVVSTILKLITQLYNQEKLNQTEYFSLITSVDAYSDICGACERIKNTPIPFSYSLFIKKFIFIYIVSMPFAFVVEFHYWTALIVPFVFYVFASLELIAEAIEDPFNLDSDDLPTDQIASNIKISVQEIFTPYIKSADEEVPV